ncbi:hypothetical protein BGZ80_009006 [Entomortierella chlamydospora]|uniref:Adhesin domain-containing protein n=1 Tax=Entomortierella chlamydospora TaxID=101097 RepID=A0A9P6N4S5_9FUNG|nr:hypothetical protein BGZ79_001610 [Entomortierella chlamydospora]KAG0023573.1 hypothetical protein BGZ80_009006 [Entomortierella chlamydospora]
MPFPNDKKGELPQVFDAEDERIAFGRQSPYATPTIPSQSIEPTAQTAPAATSTSAPVPQPSTPSSFPTERPSAPQALPHSQNEHSYNSQDGHVAVDVPPPAYEDVVQRRQSRPPQQHYQPDEDNNTSPSAPLLGRSPTADYSSIPATSNTPITRAAPSHSPSISGSSTSDDSERPRRFNKFWFWFIIIIIVLLLIGEKDENMSEKCRNPASRTLADYLISPDYTDFTVTMANMPSYIVVDQGGSDELDEGMTRISAIATASDQEDLQNIGHEIKHEQYGRAVKASFTHSSNKVAPECLETMLRITFPTSMEKLMRLRLRVNEGNITINLLEPNKTLPLQYLESTVITGHNYIRADVAQSTKVGGTKGTLKGEIVVRRELSANLIDGDVSLNLIQSPGVLVSSKINVVNGDIKVGMDENYEGSFKLKTTNGSVRVMNADPRKTRIKSSNKNAIEGWHTINGKEPVVSSDLVLSSLHGEATLSLRRIEI